MTRASPINGAIGPSRKSPRHHRSRPPAPRRLQRGVLVNARRDRTMNQDNETLLRSVDLAIESIKKYGAPKE